MLSLLQQQDLKDIASMVFKVSIEEKTKAISSSAVERLAKQLETMYMSEGKSISSLDSSYMYT